MRILKDPEERKCEIMDTAERLFTTKGYNQTTILDILNEIGIAKGTFYYYFKSKEEVMDAIIMRIINEGEAAAKKIAETPGLSAMEKLFMILSSKEVKNSGGKEKVIEQFHQPNNADMHQKSLVLSIQKLSPILAKVVEQGINELVFETDYPQETVELLLAASSVIFDDGLFHWEEDEAMRRMRAFVCLMETSLGVEKGILNDLINILT